MLSIHARDPEGAPLTFIEGNCCPDPILSRNQSDISTILVGVSTAAPKHLHQKQPSVDDGTTPCFTVWMTAAVSSCRLVDIPSQHTWSCFILSKIQFFMAWMLGDLFNPFFISWFQKKQLRLQASKHEFDSSSSSWKIQKGYLINFNIPSLISLKDTRGAIDGSAVESTCSCWGCRFRS